MKTGAVVGGYTLLEDFRVVGAGLSEWTFAERDGREYFIKRFLSPTFPDDDAPGSAATKARKRERCAAFEAHHRGIQVALAPVTRYRGNLITTLDFFRQGAKYYKVTEKIDPAGMEVEDVARLEFSAKLVLMMTVAHSLRILHELHIVHGDLKPSNVLIKRTELGYTTKLIDFDSSYVVGNPPPADEIVGTINFYSPELARYVQGADNASELTEGADIFALGLIYAEYLTGSVPPFDPAHHEPAIAVLNGEPLLLPPAGLPGPVAQLVNRMLLADPDARPSIDEVHATLMAQRPGAPTTTAKPPLPVVRPDSHSTSALRGKGLRIADAGVPTIPGSSSATRTGPPADSGARDSGLRSLVGRLLTRAEKGRSR
ncbi:protein kinase [Nakamurella sp. A5-74]|uniref:non-specific serine/threonine protein kinase n=1 Tax=Nakamurella sp. A5-74 TaxID=3158264 RepID=A0AAU8DPR3_9ACTN